MQDAPAPYLGELEAPHGDFGYCYVVKHQGDGVKYHYTAHSANITITNLPVALGTNPQVFESAQIKHSPRTSREEFEGQSFDLQVAVYEDRIPRMFYASIPKGIEVTVIKIAQGLLQEASPTVDFLQHCLITQSGVAQHVTLSGQIVSLQAIPLPYTWQRKIPRYWFQRACNHILYASETCGVSAAAHNFATTITALERAKRRITLSGQRPASSADYFTGGWMRQTSTGEDCAIEVSEHSGPNTRIVVRTWNPELVVTDAVTLFAGCNRTKDHCLNKFSNLAKFGGFAQIPEKNPVIHGV